MAEDELLTSDISNEGSDKQHTDDSDPTTDTTYSSNDSTDWLEDLDSDHEQNLPTFNVSALPNHCGRIATIMRLLLYLLFQFYVKWRISDRAMDWLLKVLYANFCVLGKEQSFLKETDTNFPKSLAGLLQSMNFSKDNLKKYVVYPANSNPACTKLYTYLDVIAYDEESEPVAVSCVHCGYQLTQEKVLRNGFIH